MNKPFSNTQLTLKGLGLVRVDKRITNSGGTKYSPWLSEIAVIAYPEGSLAFTPAAVRALGNPTRIVTSMGTGIAAFTPAPDTEYSAYKLSRGKSQNGHGQLTRASAAYFCEKCKGLTQPGKILLWIGVMVEGSLVVFTRNGPSQEWEHIPRPKS